MPADVAFVALATTVITALLSAVGYVFKLLMTIQAQRYDALVAQQAATLIAQNLTLAKTEADRDRERERGDDMKKRCDIWEANCMALATQAARSITQVDLITHQSPQLMAPVNAH